MKTVKRLEVAIRSYGMPQYLPIMPAATVVVTREGTKNANKRKEQD